MKDKKSWFKELLPYIIILAIVIIIKHFVVTTIVVHGSSMMNTLHDKDIMILNKIGKNDIKRFDIVVIDTGKTKLIKRVIGLPNEVVEYKDHVLYINDEVVEDPYENGETPDMVKLKLGKNKYIVLGDNRGDSLDSSELGAFKKSQIVGKTRFTIWPFNRFGKK